MEGGFDRFIRGGGSYEYTFNRAGVYPYNMKYFVSNKGTVTVLLPEEKVEEDEGIKPGSPKTIYIQSTGFSPAEINIKRGTKISFVNKDAVHHHITISGDPFIHDLAPNGLYSLTFNELGEFSFYDPYNVADYSGKVSVTS